jgi:uncharacterized DUF497 family protein
LNVKKHGVSLEAACWFEWDEAVSWVDSRQEYGEVRVCCIGHIRRRLYCLVYAERGAQRRIISLRKANMREVKRYAET